MARQLSLGLPFTESFDPADYIVGDCNREAAELVRKRSEWKESFLCVIGEKGSGKTHLTALFHALHPTSVRKNAAELNQEVIRSHPNATRFILDDADTVRDEVAFFHLLNTVIERKGALFATARNAPLEWNIAIPDLRSRLSAFSVAFLRPPDSDFLSGVLLKLLSDRQIRTDISQAEQMMKYIHPSFFTVKEAVNLIDSRLYAVKKPLNLSVFKKIVFEIPDLLSPYGQEKYKTSKTCATAQDGFA